MAVLDVTPIFNENFKEIQGRSQDFISTEAKEWTGRGSGASRGKARGQGVRGRSPAEAESFPVVGYPEEMENLL